MIYLWLTVEDVEDPPLATICERLGVIEGDLDPAHGRDGLTHLGSRAGRNAYSVMVRKDASPNLTAEGVSGPWSETPVSPALGAMDPDRRKTT